MTRIDKAFEHDSTRYDYGTKDRHLTGESEAGGDPAESAGGDRGSGGRPPASDWVPS